MSDAKQNLHESESDLDSYNSILEQFSNINDSLTLFKMQISTLQQKLKCV